MGKMSGLTQLNAENFESETAGKLCLIDFWAEWCGPCRMFTPILEELAREVDGSILIAKINVDDNQELAARFGVRNIPAVFILKDGEVVKQFSGVQDKMTLKKALENA